MFISTPPTKRACSTKVQAEFGLYTCNLLHNELKLQFNWQILSFAAGALLMSGFLLRGL